MRRLRGKAPGQGEIRTEVHSSSAAGEQGPQPRLEQREPSTRSSGDGDTRICGPETPMGCRVGRRGGLDAAVNLLEGDGKVPGWFCRCFLGQENSLGQDSRPVGTTGGGLCRRGQDSQAGPEPWGGLGGEAGQGLTADLL